jgi:uncharacterized protein (UPF0333 family)
MKRLRDESGHASVIPALCMPSLFGSVPLAPPGVREQGMAQRATGRAVVAGASGPIFDRWLQRLLRNQGQALIEYILVIPLVFLLAVNVVNFGGFFYAFIAVANAARAGADYAILAGAAAGSPVQGTATTINNLITTDISSLPNKSSLSVNICQSIYDPVLSTTTVKVVSGACTSIPSDPEKNYYVLTSVDVTYTYLPFIPLFSFPNLHINATLPATTIHRRAVMRSIQ